MDANILRQKLHEYIDVADQRILSAIYTLVQYKISSDVRGKYDQATLDMIYKRREDHKQGLSKSYTVEESMNLIRQYKK